MTISVLMAKTCICCVVVCTVFFAKSEDMIDVGPFRACFESAARIFATNAPAFQVAVHAERDRISHLGDASSTNAAVLALAELSLLNNMATNQITWNARQIQIFSEMAIDCLAVTYPDTMKEDVILRFAAARSAIKALRVADYEYSGDINAPSLELAEIAVLNMRRNSDRRQRTIAQSDDDMGMALVLNMIAYARGDKGRQRRMNLVKKVSEMCALSPEDEKAVLVGDWCLVRKQRK